jgi:hypothetical protein
MERSTLKNLTRESRITAKDYDLFSMETKEESFTISFCITKTLIFGDVRTLGPGFNNIVSLNPSLFPLESL